MKYQSILFDLDGTLLPMDNDAFIKGYLHMLADHVSSLGYKENEFISTMWKGVGKMIANDGSKPNADRFWEYFTDIFGKESYSHIPFIDEFYRTGFHNAKALTLPSELPKRIVERAKQVSGTVILATNPFFPRVAVNSRLSWIGLTENDFELITDYENSSFCKPNPAYYTEILQKLGLNATECLMVGNNTKEDILAAQEVGLQTYLVTDHVIAEGELPVCDKGSLKELYDFL